MSKEMLELADRIEGTLPQLVTNVDKDEKADAYRLIISSSERQLLSALLRASAVAEPERCPACDHVHPRGALCIGIKVGAGGGVVRVPPKDAHPAPAAPVPASVREALELAQSAFREQGISDRVPITLGRIERALAFLPAPAAAPTREEIISIVEDECFLNDFSPVEKTKSRKTLWRVGNVIRERILALKSAPAE